MKGGEKTGFSEVVGRFEDQWVLHQSSGHGGDFKQHLLKQNKIAAKDIAEE